MEIPTIKVTIQGREIEINSWLTQEQEDEYNSLILGEEGFDVGSNQESVTFKASMKNITAGRKYLISSIVKGITWEEFNVSPPAFRAELVEKIEEVRGGGKK